EEDEDEEESVSIIPQPLSVNSVGVLATRELDGDVLLPASDIVAADELPAWAAASEARGAPSIVPIVLSDDEASTGGGDGGGGGGGARGENCLNAPSPARSVASRGHGKQ